MSDKDGLARTRSNVLLDHPFAVLFVIWVLVTLVLDLGFRAGAARFLLFLFPRATPLEWIPGYFFLVPSILLFTSAILLAGFGAFPAAKTPAEWGGLVALSLIESAVLPFLNPMALFYWFLLACATDHSCL